MSDDAPFVFNEELTWRAEHYPMCVRILRDSLMTMLVEV